MDKELYIFYIARDYTYGFYPIAEVIDVNEKKYTLKFSRFNNKRYCKKDVPKNCINAAIFSNTEIQNFNKLINHLKNKEYNLYPHKFYSWERGLIFTKQAIIDRILCCISKDDKPLKGENFKKLKYLFCRVMHFKEVDFEQKSMPRAF